MEPGDIVSAVDREPVARLTMAQLYLKLYALHAGQVVAIDLEREAAIAQSPPSPWRTRTSAIGSRSST